MRDVAWPASEGDRLRLISFPGEETHLQTRIRHIDLLDSFIGLEEMRGDGDAAG